MEIKNEAKLGVDTRIKPDWITWEFFNHFTTWADRNGVGTHEDDWMPWLNCWIDGARVMKIAEGRLTI